MNQNILSGGDALFEHNAVKNFYTSVMSSWSPDKNKQIALLLGCTQDKPYSKSFMHKKVIAMLAATSADAHVQQYIVGEPLVICPREWEKNYPAAHYDFPPSSLGVAGRETFTYRLRVFFERFGEAHRRFIVFAPNHHRDVITEACAELVNPLLVPYNLYKLPLLRKTIVERLGETTD